MSETKIKIFRLDDCEWWAGESLEACVAAGRTMNGADCYPDDPIQREVSEAELQELTFVDTDDYSERSFAEELRLVVESGATFPCFFAATDW